MKLRLPRMSSIQVSIKALTLLGFSLVALPLVAALIYSAQQVDRLSQQSTNAIFDVAERVENNRVLSQAQARLERFAGQYVVLKDSDLLDKFNTQLTLLEQTLPSVSTTDSGAHLNKLRTLYLNQLRSIQQTLKDPQLTLVELQDEFKKVAQLNQQIGLQSDQWISAQANKVKTSAAQIEDTMIWSLYVVPITLFIAGVFILLIIHPLKSLKPQIKWLEKGNFQHPISVNGSIEMTEIANTLELMRCRLHELELQKSSFIRHISHELKTPLAAIREGTELIYDNSVGELNTAQQEIIHIIRSSVSRLQTLIEDLLDFNIVLDSTSLQDANLIQIDKTLSQCLEAHSLDINRKQLTVNLDAEPIHIQCNAKQLNVVLENLLSNAIKFSPEQGTVTISAKKNHSHLKLSVVDQGPGIPKTAFEDVFTAFYQGPSQHDSPIKSSGLGLTIVKELLLRLNGTVTIQSSTQAPTFTEFVIHIPLTTTMQ